MISSGGAERVVLEATGPAGVFPATWAQASQYRAHTRADTGAALLLRAVLPLPDGCRSADLLAAVRAVAASYDALRSTLRWNQDGTGLSQVVHERVRIEVALRRYPSRAAASRSLHPEQTHTASLESLFDAPVNQVTVLYAAASPAYLVWQVPHVFVDGWAVGIVRQAVLDLLSGTRTVADLAASEQPRHRAEREGSPAGRRGSDRAVDYWLRTVRRYHRGDWSRPAPGPAHTYALGLHAAAADLAHVVDRFSVPSSVVLLGCVATAICQVTGSAELVVQSDYANRFTPRDRDSVTCLVQPAFVGLAPGAADSAARFLSTVQDSTMRAYRAAQYHPDDLHRVRVEAERSDQRGYRTPLCFNDMRAAQLRRVVGSGADAGDTVALVGTDDADGYSDLYVWPREDADGLSLRLRTAERRFSRSQSEQLLLAVPRLIGDLARDRWCPAVPRPAGNDPAPATGYPA